VEYQPTGPQVLVGVGWRFPHREWRWQQGWLTSVMEAFGTAGDWGDG